MTFDATYRSELAFLRDMGREIALARPGLCDTLAVPGSDPDVERLLEGFAFLAARTRERADDALPEAIEAIAEVVAPHALRPVPASTVMELTPRAGLVRERVTVRAGAAFGARPVDGVRCELRSTWDVDLLPLVIERTLVDRTRTRSPRIVLTLRAPRAALDAVHAARPLRFYVDAPLAVASGIALAIDRSLTDVRFRAQAAEVGLGEAAALVDPDAEPHLPWPDVSPVAGRHLAELAYFPERHLFFDVRGLERVPVASRGERFELALHFAEGTVLPDTLAEDALRLHCVPAINLFLRDAEPLSWRDDSSEGLLRASGLPSAAIEVYDVGDVVGLAEGARGRRTYRSFATFDHLGETARGYFALRRERSPLDGGVDTFLRVGERATTGAETLSCSLRCTNRHLVTRLRAGDVCEAIPGAPTMATFRNLAPLGPRASARVGQDGLYALVGASAPGHRARLTVSALRGWLGAHSVASASDVGRARTCAALARAITAVRAHPFRAARRGVIERAVAVEIELDEGLAPSRGESFLLARALDRALASELPLSVRQQLSIALMPSRARIELPLRAGA